ncbi:hypothetical protein PIB30_030344 [Stylosanthes scabra]|uniref:Uncharacterized protein n=1 Tax=Stylosanthes scabra TaxID=79078 RepID=A0ABU6UBD2_9FABA|nr:hypothetical protein [Stylosanthes scabra]
MIPQFGGVQNRPHPALNIDFLQAKNGHRSDQWFPHTFQRWHALWATRYCLIYGCFRHPVSYACQKGASRPRKGGRAGRNRGEGSDAAPAQQTQGGASTSQPQAFLDGLSSPGFQQMISDIMLEGGSGYRPNTHFDGSPVHLDLNEPVSGLSHLFMALGGTPPSTSHVPGAS